MYGDPHSPCPPAWPSLGFYLLHWVLGPPGFTGLSEGQKWVRWQLRELWRWPEEQLMGEVLALAKEKGWREFMY